ncbi:response regulator, partial [Acinetobacter baumannii]
TYQVLRNTSAERFAPRVLIVEDDRELSAVLKFDLEKKGYTCRQGYSLSEARTLLQEELPHAVILDLGLPDGSGLDL